MPLSDPRRPGDPRSVLYDVFETFADPNASGRCTKCHTTDLTKHGIDVNWHGFQADPRDRQFTKFSHLPHLTALGDHGCTTCHVQKGQWTRYRSEFMNPDGTTALDPNSFSSDFKGMTTTGCATCHGVGKARDNCLTCHNYHVRLASPDEHNLFPLPLSGEPDNLLPPGSR